MRKGLMRIHRDNFLELFFFPALSLFFFTLSLSHLLFVDMVNNYLA